MARITSIKAAGPSSKPDAARPKRPATGAKRRSTKAAAQAPPQPEAALGAAAAPVFAKGGPAAARVRMYRQGLGDCFLLTLPRAAGSRKTGDFHILFDCGVILGTENKSGRLQQVVEDV